MAESVAAVARMTIEATTRIDLIPCLLFGADGYRALRVSGVQFDALHGRAVSSGLDTVSRTPPRIEDGLVRRDRRPTSRPVCELRDNLGMDSSPTRRGASNQHRAHTRYALALPASATK